MTSTLLLVLKLVVIVAAVLLAALPAWGQGPAAQPLELRGQVGAMLAAELRYDRWAVLFDSQHIKPDLRRLSYRF